MKSHQKFRRSQVCAACVPYGGQEKYAWIVTRFERQTDDGHFLVRDEYAINDKFVYYTVPQNRIIQFPIRDAMYDPGERILALWCDQETGEWTTKFYEAVVLKSGRCSKLTIQYKESDTTVDIEPANVTKFPPGYDLFNSNQLSVSEPPSEVEDVQSRRVEFKYSPTNRESFAPFSKLDDDEFTHLCEPSHASRRVFAKKGTPLINFLEDEMLFPKERWRVISAGSINIIPK